MAAQPPRPPPNNVLFCGPPPALPHVMLLPSDVPIHRNTINPTDTIHKTNDADNLHEINNVGVPTYEGKHLNDDQLQKLRTESPEIDYRIPLESCLRRTHSFDISHIFTTQIENYNDTQAFQYRHWQSEPDLSKYGLFMEAEVTMECAPLQPNALILNNPFYDGSYALDPSQLDQTMVVMPENYLAFEDSFVPTWNYKPEFLMNGDMQPELYYDGIPLIPTNDPWSAYCNENAAFEYYSPHFEAPVGNSGGVNYVPLTDLEYSVPQYMSLPIVEEANVSFTNSYLSPEDTLQTKTDTTSERNNNIEQSHIKLDLPVSSNVVNSIVVEDDKSRLIDLTYTNKESSSRSPESLIADISNDVTSSLAFVPSSKSSQRPEDADDTSDDTSPCSTDYHEASALDLVQSLDELSCCDSTDFSQSRDEGSPIGPETPSAIETAAVNVIDSTKTAVLEICEISKNYCSEVHDVLISTQTSPKLPLGQIPSIPLHERVIEKVLPENKLTNKDLLSEHIPQISSNESHIGSIPQPEIPKESESKYNETSQKLPETVVVDGSIKNCSNDMPKMLDHPPQPPAVPTSWLACRPTACNSATTTQHPPQILVHNAEGIPKEFEKSPKPPSQPSTMEPQPSCSYMAPQPPAQSSQLKPDKQPKEVEVSQLF